MNHRQLWKKIFGDNDAYIDFYFKERADHTVVYSKYEGHDLVSICLLYTSPSPRDCS